MATLSNKQILVFETFNQCKKKIIVDGVNYFHDKQDTSAETIISWCHEYIERITSELLNFFFLEINEIYLNLEELEKFKVTFVESLEIAKSDLKTYINQSVFEDIFTNIENWHPNFCMYDVQNSFGDFNDDED